MHTVYATTMVLALATIVGCSGSARVSGESARLRTDIVQLQDRIEQLERRNKELELELQRTSQAPGEMPNDLCQALPLVTQIEIQRLSFAHDTDGDGSADQLTLYISPQDGRGRFTQLIGELTASALHLPAQGEPQVIGRVTLTPVQVRDAYRSGVTGTHYTIEVPLDQLPRPSSADSPQDIFARVHYRDGMTGQTFTAERKISLP